MSILVEQEPLHQYPNATAGDNASPTESPSSRLVVGATLLQQDTLIGLTSNKISADSKYYFGWKSCCSSWGRGAHSEEALLCLTHSFPHLSEDPEFPVLKTCDWTSLMAQWWRIHLSTEETQVQSLIQEDPTCCRAAKPMHHDYWAFTLGPGSHSYWARVLQPLKLTLLEAALHSKGSHRDEKPLHCSEEQPLLIATGETPYKASKT